MCQEGQIAVENYRERDAALRYNPIGKQAGISYSLLDGSLHLTQILQPPLAIHAFDCLLDLLHIHPDEVVNIDGDTGVALGQLGQLESFDDACQSGNT
jgi:hypothetical protein